MSDVLKYELPPTVVKPSGRYVSNQRPLFDEPVSIISDPVSPRGKVVPVGLEVDLDVAPHLAVLDVRVGKNSQHVSASCVPASLFALDPPIELLCDPIPPGLRFRVDVVNTGRETVTFRGRLLARDLSKRAVMNPNVDARSWVVGLGYTEIKPGQTVAVVASPMVAISLERLHVPPQLLDVFRVDALYQGRYLDVQQVSRVTDFRQLDRENLLAGGKITLDSCPVVGIGQPVTVEVTNVSEEVQYFTGALLGAPVHEGAGAEERATT